MTMNFYGDRPGAAKGAIRDRTFQLVDMSLYRFRANELEKNHIFQQYDH